MEYARYILWDNKSNARACLYLGDLNGAIRCTREALRAYRSLKGI